MVDALILISLALAFVSGWTRGVGRQLWSLAALGASTYVSGNIYFWMAGLTGSFIHDVAGSRLVSFALVFGILSGLLNGPVNALIRLGRGRYLDEPWFGDRLASGILGLIEGIGVIEVAALLLVAYPVLEWDGWIKASGLIRAFLEQVPLMLPLLPNELSSMTIMFR
jgi:uncharacterized membrane protein required for colicin V production